MLANMLRGQDWLKVLLMACFTSYLVYRIYVSTNKLLERQMGSTEMTRASQEMLLPSVTLCLDSFLHQTQRSTNITEDFDKLPRLSKMVKIVTQIVSIQNKLVKT